MVFVSGQMVQCTLVDFVYHHEKHKYRMKERAKNVIKRFRRLSEQKRTLLVPDIKSRDYKQPVSQWKVGSQLMNCPQEKAYPFSSYQKIFSNTNIKVSNNVMSDKKVTKEQDCFFIGWAGKVLTSLTSVPTTPDKPEYLPMKIDAISRIIFPLFFISICLFYWPTMLMKTF